jgi:hypothetical protein
MLSSSEAHRNDREVKEASDGVHIGVLDGHTFLVEEPWFYLIPAWRRKRSSKEDIVGT